LEPGGNAVANEQGAKHTKLTAKTKRGAWKRSNFIVKGHLREDLQVRLSSTPNLGFSFPARRPPNQ
jgi:hypothetical protein